ncbi:MAG: 1-deoxy-D-xylulose-5-phosphate reductoisomerase [Melioribacteraceae bacterium]|nr:1-deoxy-D-xylulose-5-phosphate reductoisomerase [Melioribacteraceae bacterium]
MKQLLLLGSTGSIGLNTLELVRTFPDKFSISGLSANENIDELHKQILEFNPHKAAVRNVEKAKILREMVGNKCEILSGDQGILEITRNSDYDVFVSALVGFAGLTPTIEAIKKKKRIALANKETLVVAGEIVSLLCNEYDVDLLPIDSEHSAIFQSLVGENRRRINKIILTASGGPFREKPIGELNKVTVKEALNHPNWKMGNKITIDSASMMNKGLEVIEAYWLFNLPKEKIEVVIHPQSIIHSMVEFIDGSIKAQLSTPDMKLPILYALTYPDRLSYNGVATDFKKINQMTFFEPDFNKFRCLKLAYDVIEIGGTAPCVLNAANEIAVEKFLEGKIKFLQIPEIILQALEKIKIEKSASLETIIEADFLTRDYLKRIFN